MILSKPDLIKAIRAKQIRFDPAIAGIQVGQASIDLRLGFSFTKLKSLQGIKFSVNQGLASIADAGFWDTKELKEYDMFENRETFCLHPGEFVLALTYESITVPKNMIALVEGRSTYARVGLSMHQTAPWIQPGWSGPIVLEIMNNGPLAIELTPLLDKPCQLTFFRLTKALTRKDAYGSKSGDIYQNQTHPIKPSTKRKKTSKKKKAIRRR